MRKLIAGLVFISLVSSCSMFFDTDKRQDGSKGLKPLSLIGGGTLSDDTAQDQHPFLFRHNGKTYIIFSSDRGTPGKMKLWYAEMNSDEMFSEPQIVPINDYSTNYSQISPSVFTYQGTNYLVFLYFDGMYYNIDTWILDEQLTPVSSFSPYQYLLPVTSIGLMQDATNPRILLASASTNIEIWAFSGNGWTNSTQTISSEIPIASVSGFNKDGIDYYIGNTTKMPFGVQQIVYGNSLKSGLFPVPFYVSEFDDFSPFVDTETYKVYFASTRYGLGNYDLYRYNYLTYDLLMGTGSHYVPPTGIIYVSPSGNSGNTGLSPSSPLLNISSAIAKASELGYGFVYVAAGTYYTEGGLNNSGSGGVVITNNNIQIIGGWDELTFSYPSGYSELEAYNSFDHIVLFESCTNVSMEFFVLRNNNSYFSADNMGGGVFFKNATYCSLNVSYISNCKAVYGGGAAFSNSYACQLVGTTISSNHATNGAGVYVYDRFNGLTGVNVINNYATGSGAAIYYYSAPETWIESCVISNNNAVGINSAIHFFAAGSSTNLLINYNWIGVTGSESYAIYEEANIINHSLNNNYFITNGMSYLYRDFIVSEVIITNGNDWTNINDVSWTGASFAMGNVVTNY